jgi:hypothetical protein
MVGLSDEKKDQVLKTHQKLEPIAKLDMGNIPNLVECYKVKAPKKCNHPQKSIGVTSLNENQMEIYPTHFHATNKGSVDIYEKPTKEQVRG